MFKFKINLEIPLPKVKPIKWYHLLFSILLLTGFVFGIISIRDVLEIMK